MNAIMKFVGALLAGTDIRHGRYLIQIAGCNDCHTAGHMQNDGQVPEAEWLTGDAIGWQGPWGTTYAANLRLLFQQIDEKTWLAYVPPGEKVATPYFDFTPKNLPPGQ
ncbi:hypothetical protein ABW22_10195 [Thiobacillus denitrificans]|uniref:Cytochrome C n=2 Tax=Thiobacillus denitrificans TaxID=36861 RepID=A0A106BN73_THIDE|nr:hypothetical protein ABW22_10195 [Thiobacillus denitrificans]